MSSAMNDGTSVSDGRGRRWMRGALIVSVAVNLFLAGVVGVWAVKPMFRDRGGEPPGGATSIAERMASRLPETDGQILRQAFQKRHDDMRKLFDEARAAQRDSRRALRATPFDPAAFAAASQRSIAARTAVQEAFNQAMGEAAAGMSTDGRAKLAQPPQRGPRRD